MWTVLDRPGDSGAPERIDLMERCIARFGRESVGLPLADREFIGTDWSDWLIRNDIPFAIRLRGGQRATTAEGRNGTLERLLAGPDGARRSTLTLDAMAANGAPGPELHVRAKRSRGREPVIVATNRPQPDPLAACRKRWAIECLFADAKRRGLNFEDTRLTCPRKLALLTAIVAIAIAWAGATGQRLLGRRRLPRKAHGHPAKSVFRIGFESIRRMLRADPIRTLDTWKRLVPTSGAVRVV